MSFPSIPSQIIQSFGFHTEASFTAKISNWGYDDSGLPNLISWTKQELNASNIISYIPILGSIAGVVRIYLSHQAWGVDSNKALKPFMVTQIVRGVMETIGLGILLLFVDLIVTLGRYIAERCVNSATDTRSYSLPVMNQHS